MCAPSHRIYWKLCWKWSLNFGKTRRYFPWHWPTVSFYKGTNCLVRKLKIWRRWMQSLLWHCVLYCWSSCSPTSLICHTSSLSRNSCLNSANLKEITLQGLIRGSRFFQIKISLTYFWSLKRTNTSCLSVGKGRTQAKLKNRIPINFTCRNLPA